MRARARTKTPTVFSSSMRKLTQNSIMFLNAIDDEHARTVQHR